MRAKRGELLPYFERLRDELAVPMILVTHQFEDVVRLATHVVLLDGGRVQAQGDLPTVSRRPELASLLGTEGVGAVIEGEVAAVGCVHRAWRRLPPAAIASWCRLTGWPPVAGCACSCSRAT